MPAKKPSRCYNCGRLIGIAAICPYCFTDQRKGSHKAWLKKKSRLWGHYWREIRKTWSHITPHTEISGHLFRVTCAMYLVQIIAGVIVDPSDFFSAIWSGPSGLLTAALGASTPALNWWGPFTANFLHGGILHLAMNMMALYYLGPLVERLTERYFFLLVYLITGALGFFLSAITGHVSLGASCAIYGILGCGAVVTYRTRSSRDPLFILFKTWIVMGLIFAVLFGFFFRIDHAGHIGGLVAGCLCGWLWGARRPSRKLLKVFKVMALTSVALTIIGWFTSVISYYLAYQQLTQLSPSLLPL